MKQNITRRALNLGLTAALGLGLFAAGSAASNSVANAGPDGKAIMEKVAETKTLAGSEAVVTMTISDGKGGNRERKLSMATKLYDGGKTEKRIIKFLAPADVKGTGVLVFDYSNKADDVKIYLPEMKKVRRIASSQRNQRFMGSEFTYGDFNTPTISDYKYGTPTSESAGGEDCWKIEVTPKSDDIAEGEGYSKKVYWVSKKTNTVRKGVFYDLDGDVFKELSTSDVKLLDPAKKRYRAMKLEMVNKKNGRKSVFKTEQIKFTPDTKDDFFTESYLSRP